MDETYGSTYRVIDESLSGGKIKVVPNIRENFENRIDTFGILKPTKNPLGLAPKKRLVLKSNGTGGFFTR